MSINLLLYTVQMYSTGTVKFDPVIISHNNGLTMSILRLLDFVRKKACIFQKMEKGALSTHQKKFEIMIKRKVIKLIRGTLHITHLRPLSLSWLALSVLPLSLRASRRFTSKQTHPSNGNMHPVQPMETLLNVLTCDWLTNFWALILSLVTP